MHIPDEVMERLLRDLEGAKTHLNFWLSPTCYDTDIASARNIIANVKDELTRYKEAKA